MDEVKTKIDDANAVSGRSKSLFDDVKTYLNFDKAPDCLIRLDASLQDSPDRVTVEEFADFLGISRQTIWNYINAGAIQYTKELGYKTSYISVKDSLIPMSFQMALRKMNCKLSEKQTNVICLNTESADPSQNKLLLESKYPKSNCITLDDIFESSIHLLHSIVPIEEVAERVKVLADADFKSLEKKFNNEKAAIDKEVDEVLKKTYIKTRKEFEKLLNETEIPEDRIHCDIDEFRGVLDCMAQQKALSEAIALRNIRLRILFDEKAKAYKLYSPCVNDEVGKEYARLYKKAYRQLVGEKIQSSIRSCLDEDHMMIHNYNLAGSISEDMSGIADVFKSIKYTYNTVILGYSSLDDSLKAFIDTLVTDIERKGSKYSVVTM